MSNFFHKPELVLRRALELESIRQSEAALALLHEVLSSRRHRTWSPTYEQIMICYLNLCLKLHKSREAKDGLHQYRNLSQSQAPGSLEKVIRYLMEQAESKCTEAKASSDALLELDDAGGEAEEGLGAASPQAIMLNTMSADPHKNQRDSTMLLPSLKFLWETYRAVLDILKSNSKLEHVYHAAALGALRFCRTYKRRTEFRRLCDMLRMHLGNLQKYGIVASAGDDGKSNNKVRGWEGWSGDSIELHLQTRFSQLETASVLHLYTEGFRTVEDIYNILQISHARRKANPNAPPPKAKLMAAYYEKLTTLFWVSENYLFHAFAWYKYYTLCNEFNRSMSEEMKQMHASAVLLATLCIPSNSNAAAIKATVQHGITSTAEDDIVKEKMARMATLLGFHTRHPTREALLTEIRSKDIMENVPDYLRDLYVLLEENADPLIMVETAKPLLEKLKQEIGITTTDSEESVDDNTLARYVKPLTSVLLLKLLTNLSVAYHTVSMDHVKSLTSGLGIPFDQVETAIVLFTQTKTLAVRIDHRAGCLRFGDPELESDTMRSQLTNLAKKLSAVCQMLHPPDETLRLAKRAQIYAEIRANVGAEHAAILERKDMIEKRKEEVERLAQDKIREAERSKAAEDAARKVEEENRLAREQRVREKEKLKKIQREMDAAEKKKYLKAMGRNTDEMTEEEMSKIDTEALAKEHTDKANKKREDAERKTREAAKRLDYLVRAVRIEELPLVKKQYETKASEDRTRYEAETIERAQKAKLQWEADVKEKAVLEAHNVFSYLKEFEDAVMVGRMLKHKEICKTEDERAEMEAEKEKFSRARRRMEEKAARIAEEEAMLKKQKEEERQAEEKARRDEATRVKEAADAELRRKEDERMARERNSRDNFQAAPAGRSGEMKYVPPGARNSSGGDSRAGGGFNDRGGGYGGGRYEGGKTSGNSRWGPSSGDDGGGTRRPGGGDGRFGSGNDDRRGGPSSSGSNDWNRSRGGEQGRRW